MVGGRSRPAAAACGFGRTPHHALLPHPTPRHSTQPLQPSLSAAKSVQKTRGLLCRPRDIETAAVGEREKKRRGAICQNKSAVTTLAGLSTVDGRGRAGVVAGCGGAGGGEKSRGPWPADQGGVSGRR